MLEKIKTNINSIIFSKAFKKTIFLGFFGFLFYSFGVEFVFAGDSPNSDIQGNLAYFLKLLQDLAGISGAIIGGLTGVIAIFLNPSWVNGTLFSISSYMKEVWIFVSNVVYLIFAGLLIVISFANIIGKGTGDIFELKKSLPKFIIGVLIVPLSWFIVQLVISISSILMVSIYVWPIETFEAKLTNIEGSVKWCDHRVVNINGNMKKEVDDKKQGFFYCNSRQESKPIKDILNMKNDDGEYSIGGIIGLYSFGVMDIGALDKFVNEDLNGIKTLSDLLSKGIFDAVFVLVYLVILVALFLALFIRVIVLWIYIMVSPVFGLLYFSSKSLGKMGEKFNFKEFIGLAMVPVYVAAALSFGLMFLLIIGEGLGDAATKKSEDGTLEKPYDFTVFKFSIEGSVSAGKHKKIFIKEIANDAVGVMGYLMLKMFGLAFLWMAVMAALKQSSITGNIIKPIEDFGGQVGKFVMESPKYMPIPGTKGLSFDGAMNVGNQVMTKIKQSSNDKAREWGQKNVSFLSSEEQKKLGKELSESMTLGMDKSFEKLKDILYKYEEKDQFMYKDKIAELMKRSGLEGSEKIEQAKTPEEFAKAMMEVNNSETNRSKKGGYLLGKKIDDPETVNQELGSKKGSGDSKDTAQTTTFNITENFSGVIKKDGEGLAINGDKGVDLLAEKLKNGGQVKGTDKIEEIIKKLVNDLGSEDRDNIVKVVDKLVEKLNISDGKNADGKKKNIGEVFDKLYPAAPKPAAPSSVPPVPPAPPAGNPTNTTNGSNRG